MFLGALILVVVGVLVMIIDTANMGFVFGLFTLMGGIFLWAISLNYGDTPAKGPGELLEGEGAAPSEPSPPPHP